MPPIHPLVRDLYKRAITLGPDYPLGLPYVRKVWKGALTNDRFKGFHGDEDPVGFVREGGEWNEKAIRLAVARGRYFLREMVGVIKLKKYREMKKRYGQEEKKFDDIVRVSRGLEEEWRGKGDG